MGIEKPAVLGFDDQPSIKSADRMKFLYSYGGRIIPRPGDWKLRYVGGQTRVMAVNRNITFADLIVKMAEVLGSNPVLKCQLPNQDLDALVSIKSDEDLHNILEEYKGQGTRKGSSKVRAFLFPKNSRPSPLLKYHPFQSSNTSKPQVAPNHSVAQTASGFLNHEPQQIMGQSHFAHSDGQYSSPSRYATKIQHGVRMPCQHNSADRAMSSVYMDYQHCLQSLFINNRPPKPLVCHYMSPSPFPATQNPQQHIRAYMKVA